MRRLDLDVTNCGDRFVPLLHIRAEITLFVNQNRDIYRSSDRRATVPVGCCLAARVFRTNLFAGRSIVQIRSQFSLSYSKPASKAANVVVETDLGARSSTQIGAGSSTSSSRSSQGKQRQHQRVFHPEVLLFYYRRFNSTLTTQMSLEQLPDP